MKLIIYINLLLIFSCSRQQQKQHESARAGDGQALVSKATVVQNKQACRNLGKEWVAKKDKSGVMYCVQSQLDEDACLIIGEQWKWAIVDGFAQCQESTDFLGTQEQCLEKGSDWSWNASSSKCSQDLTVKIAKHQCLEKGESFVWVEPIDKALNNSLGHCHQLGDEITALELCLKKSGWEWLDNSCQQNSLTITLEQLCSDQGGNWHYVDELGQIKCKEIFDFVEGDQACRSRGVDWHYSSSGDSLICKQGFDKKSAQDLCLEKGVGWTFNSTSQICSKNMSNNVAVCEQLNNEKAISYNAYGLGSDNSPFLICNINQFLDFAQNACGLSSSKDCDKSYLLGASMMLASPVAMPLIGSGSSGFSGHFDGNGNMISNLIIMSEPSQKNIGLFSTLNETAILKNLFLDLLSVKGNDNTNVGSVVGLNHGKITNVWVSGVEVICSDCQNIGGFIGFNSKSGFIESSHSIVSMTANQSSIGYGGFVGMNQGAIKTSSSDGTISNINVSQIGGFVAFNFGQFGGYKGLLEDITSKVKITEFTGNRYIGGVSASTNLATFTRVQYIGPNPLSNFIDNGNSPNFQGKISGRVQNLNNLPLTPALSLLSPCKNVAKDPNPVIRVTGISMDDTVKLYSDSECKKLVASNLSTETTLDIHVNNLSPGTYLFYAKVYDSVFNESLCSSNPLKYTFEFPSFEFQQARYNVVNTEPLLLNAGGVSIPPYTFSMNGAGRLVSGQNSIISGQSFTSEVPSVTFISASDLNALSIVTIVDANLQTAKATISSLVSPSLWLDASAIACKKNNDPVHVWKDLSSSTAPKNFAQVDSNKQPEFIENILNSMPVVRFSTNGQFLSNSNSINLGSSGGQATGFVVAKIADTSKKFANALITKEVGDLGFLATGKPARLSLQKIGDSKTAAQTLLQDRLAIPENTTRGDYHIFYYTYSTTSASVFLDLGSVDNPSEALVTNSHAKDITIQSMMTYIGYDPKQVDTFSGDMAEVILFNSVLTSNQLREVAEYLAKKYDLQPKKWTYNHVLVDGRSSTTTSTLNIDSMATQHVTVSLFGGGGGGASGFEQQPGGGGGSFAQATFPVVANQKYIVTAGGPTAGLGWAPSSGVCYSGYAQTIVNPGKLSSFKIDGVDWLIAYGGQREFKCGYSFPMGEGPRASIPWADTRALNYVGHNGGGGGGYTGQSDVPSWGGGGAGDEAGPGWSQEVPRGGRSGSVLPSANCMIGNDGVVSKTALKGGTGGSGGGRGCPSAGGQVGGFPGGGGGGGGGTWSYGGSGGAGAAYIEYRSWK